MCRVNQLGLTSVIFSSLILLDGCNNFEEAHSIDEKMNSSESLGNLEEEVFELYSLAPCSRSHGYCSSSFLIEQVDALIVAYCLEGLSQEALRVYAIFEHFEDPSPQPPGC